MPARQSALRTADFSYELPPELIATRPAPRRADSRLLVLRRSDRSITHQTFRDLPAWLSPGDLLVLNDTRVRPSVLTSRCGAMAFTLLEETSPRHWVALAKPGRKAKPGTRWQFAPLGGPSARAIEAEVLATLPEGERVLRFFSDFDVHEFASVPLPPYILKQRTAAAGAPPEPDADDAERYQTVYARPDAERSVAAPTAGLHFTPDLLERLPHAFLTLHVGLGTFRPVKTEYVADHVMHEEAFEIPEALAARAAAADRLVAVGTTVARVLESVPDLAPRRGRTRIFIHPPYAFQRVGALITNFHLPQSTLLMLVCAFGGTELVLGAYREAIEHRYRFYSYGDAMLIL